jgi:hypothetical protein
MHMRFVGFMITLLRLTIAVCGAALLAGMSTAPEAHASTVPANIFAGAGGCTASQGPYGAGECIQINGPWGNHETTHIDKVLSSWSVAPQVTDKIPQDCDRHHELSYYQHGKQVVRTIDPTGCLYSFQEVSTGDHAVFYPNVDVDSGSQVCVRVRNSVTTKELPSNPWSPYACWRAA